MSKSNCLSASDLYAAPFLQTEPSQADHTPSEASQLELRHLKTISKHLGKLQHIETMASEVAFTGCSWFRSQAASTH